MSHSYKLLIEMLLFTQTSNIILSFIRCPLLLCKVHTQLLELMMNTPEKDMNHNQDENVPVTGKDEHNTKDSHTAFQMLTGFMFGNIDEKEKLVEDVLDKVSSCIRHY